MASQLFPLFVHCETGRICGNFKQNVTRLAKVYRVEILAVHDRRRVVSLPLNVREPCQLLLIIRGALGDVMHGPDSHSSLPPFRRAHDVHDARRSRSRGHISAAAGFFGTQLESHGLCQQRGRAMVGFLGERGAVKAMNGELYRHRSFREGPVLGHAIGAYQLDAHAIRIVERQDRLLEPRAGG